MKEISTRCFYSEVSTEHLKSGSIFGAISSEAIQFLIENGTLYSAQVGEVVFNYGDPGDKFYVVAKGELGFIKHYQGNRKHIRSVEFGNELGFVAMIALHPHTGDAVVNKDSLLIEISSELFYRLHENYPFDFGIITLNLARDLARSLGKISSDLVEEAPATEEKSIKKAAKKRPNRQIKT